MVLLEQGVDGVKKSGRVPRAANKPIGQKNESSLHAALKMSYAEPGDALEYKLENYVVDIAQENRIIEIQTKNLYSMKEKLDSLSKEHDVMVVYPISEEKYISRLNGSHEPVSRKKSPKKGKPIDVFGELMRCPKLLDAENVSLEIVMVKEEEVRCEDGKGSWRRKGVSIIDRRLLEVGKKIRYHSARDLLMLLPEDIPQPFTNKMLAEQAGISIALARKTTYCLKKAGVIEEAGKKGKELCFRIIAT